MGRPFIYRPSTTRRRCCDQAGRESTSAGGRAGSPAVRADVRPGEEEARLFLPGTHLLVSTPSPR